MSKKKPKTVGEYLTSAKTIKKLVPSLTKYSRRKTLSRWEKSAITRASNKVSAWGGEGALIPVSKRDIRRLKNKNAVVGNGIQAFHVTNIAKGGTAVVDMTGELEIKSNGRTFKSLSLPVDLDVFLGAGRDLLESFPGKRVSLYLWTRKGRAGKGFRSFPKLAKKLIDDYFNAYKQTDRWLLGYVYLVE